jgi:uncharacterized phage protein (TIGR02218 family)
MKRTMPTGLITWLQANGSNCARADLFTAVLPNGETLCATSGQFDITVPSGTPGWSGATTTFYASQWGVWDRGAITSEASFDLSSNTMDLTCRPQQGTTYPGAPTGILNAALSGLFDACQVTVQTVYMPLSQYGDVSNGVETKFVGQITAIQSISRNLVKFQCADYLYLLNVKVPTRIIQSNCPWGFADTNCSLTASTYTQNFTAKAGTTSWVLTPVTAFSQPSDYFTQGVVKCLTGPNNGLSQAVKLHDASGNLEVMYPWLFPPAAGDTFSVIAGCDKSVTACTQKFDNLVHFGGMPLVPVPQSAI